MTNAEFLGAIASNAGDEFHVLWAAREMLRLLEIDEDVIAVKVEGPPQDEVHAQIGEHGQAADVTLVRETTNFPSYRYLQLKHSASNPEATWTWSRLLANRAPTKPHSSVLGKLAGLMKAVAFKGDFAIVTNQPLSKTVAEDVSCLRDYESRRTEVHGELVNKLTGALGLTQEELLTFLKAWDLSGFSTSSRLIMEGELLQKLAGMYDADARDDANLLQKRVATLMLPESRNDPPVTRELLATWLGIGNESFLYPAPSRIRPASPYLRRPVVEALTAKLAVPQERPLRIHASGGCGKTSLLCDLKFVLPQGSEVLIYDCYGGGLFLASDQKRHLAEQAFTQMGNELAARFRTPLVVRRHGSIDIFDAFRNRVAVAAALLKERNPGAFLLLCFDAIDNARKGALHWHDPCFIDVLNQASGWPANVRVVVSCRTARLDEVGSSALFQDFEIEPLDVNEVEKLVALWQPDWSPTLASTFHNLTGGNPRRIAYAIEGLPSDGVARAIERLMPKAEGINPLFEQRVAEAGKHLGDAGKVWEVLDALARLPRPVPGEFLANLTSIARADIHDIAADVGGILEREEGWSFHDEDFEAFVIDRRDNKGKEMLARAVDLLYRARLTDRYAATSIAEVLAAAGRLDALYALVTQDEPSSSILSKLEAQFVWSRRLRLAIRCSREVSDIANACSLLIASADAIGRARLLEDLTVDNLDLSVRYVPEEANRLVMVGQRHRNKRARLRIELARETVYTQPGAATSHLRWWNAQLRELREKDRRDNFSLKSSDIASEYSVYAALHGEKAAFDRLFDWRPKAALLPVFQILATRAAGRNAEALRRAISARSWPPTALAPLMAAALLAGISFTVPEMRAGLDRLACATRARWPKYIETGLAHAHILSCHEAALLVAECAAEHEELHPHVERLLDRAFPKPELEETHHLYRLRSAGARHARAHALRERITGIVIAVSDWLPPKRSVPSNPKQKRGRREERAPELVWNEVLIETTSAYTRLVDAARATLKGLTDRNLAATWPLVEKALDVSRTYEEGSRRDPDAALLLMRNHLVHTSLAKGEVPSLVPRVRQALKGWLADSIVRIQDVARTLALIPHTHDTVLSLLTALPDEINNHPLPASERVKLLSQCARIALPLDSPLAEWLFGKAVDATAAVDFEARSALAAAGAMAATGLKGTHAETARLAARLGDAAGAVAESLDLGGDFAWDKAAGWVAAANVSTGLAAAARWHDRGVAPFDHTLPVILKTSNAFTLAQYAALATLASDDGIDTNLVPDDGRPLPSWFVQPALAALQLSGKITPFLQRFEAIESRATLDAMTALNAARQYRNTLSAWQAEVRNGKSMISDEDEDALDEDPVDLEPIHDIGGIKIALAAEKVSVGRHTYCRVARKLAGLALRIPFLEVALESAGTDSAFGEALPEILESWSEYPPVTDWVRKHMPGYIARALRGLLGWGYDDTEALDTALAATGLGPAEQANILLEGVEHQGDGISADMLYVLTGMIAARVPESQRARLFDALLQRVENRTSHPPQVRLTSALASEDTSKSVACTLFAAMGDMDQRVRWRAAHAGLFLLRGADPAWGHLADCLATEGSDAFNGKPFYRYGALEQLMMTIQQGTLENPDRTAPYAGLILNTIRREPHLIVRELGRATLLALDAANAAVLDVEDRIFVEKINRSQLPPVSQEARLPHYRVTREEKSNRKYSFDDTDAIPYWYATVVSMFDVPMNQFLDRMEHWLHGRWGFEATATHWVREPRLQRLERARDLASRRHGSRPTIERLSYHIEWHAMMCAVGELIVERPLVKQREGEDRFDEWIYRNMPTHSPYWLSDLRTPPPLEPRFWGLPPSLPSTSGTRFEDREASAQAWGRSIDREVFDAETVSPDGIVVAASFELRWHGAIQRVAVHSALVSPENALALTRALASARNRMDFALPDDLYHENIEFPPYHLEAWLRTPERTSYADRFDVQRGVATGIRVYPTGATCAEELTFDFEKSLWHSSAGDRAISIAQWGSDEGHDGGGWRATGDRTFLANLLARTKRSLLLNVEVSRQVADEEVGSNRTHWALYILDAAGNLLRTERCRRDLGAYLVQREGLSHSVDTLGRWMLYHAAELDGMRKTSTAGRRAALDRQIDALCRAFRRRRRY